MLATYTSMGYQSLPWAAGLLRQPHPEPRPFVEPFADHLPAVVSVARHPSHLVLKHLRAQKILTKESPSQIHVQLH